MDEIIKRLRVLADECCNTAANAYSRGYINTAEKYYAKKDAYLTAIEVIKNNHKGE